MSSHRSRHRAKMRSLQTAAATAPAAMPHPSPMPHIGTSGRPSDVLNYFAGGTGVEAARWTPNRGSMDYAPLDTSRVLTGHSRKTVLKKCRWLALNDGYAKFLVHGLSNLIGFYQLQPATKDKAWNKIAEAHWKNRIKTPAVFDRLGKFSHARWQLALSRGSIRDGDILTLRTYAASGAGQVLVYGGHQIDSGTKEERPGLRDGIYHDNLMAHTGYNLVDPGDPSKSTVIKSSDAIYYGDFSDAGELRPMPRFTHAVNDLHDIAEIDLDSKLGIKRRQFIGLYKKRQRAQTGTNGLGYYQSPVSEVGITQTQTNSDGTTSSKSHLVNVEAVTDRTGISSLDEGEDYGVVQADNPGPNEREFNKALLTKISLGLGLPPSTVFAMLGAGGPEVRFHMALLQRWISIELLNLITAVQSHYFWVIGTDIARGVLPAPQGDDQWWNNIAIPCADLTIDRGRELNGKIAALKVGALTHADLFGEAGKDWEDQLEIQAEIIAHAATLAAEKGLAGGLADLMPDWNPRMSAKSPVAP
jgi:hypothetical protein